MRDNARKFFEESGLQYSDIKRSDMYLLLSILENELSKFNNNGFTMSIITAREKHIHHTTYGGLVKAFIRVRGNHFKSREAISFNENGFIGFAGWADNENVKPFTTAFIKWLKARKELNHE